jgi:hypothetical protein
VSRFVGRATPVRKARLRRKVQRGERGGLHACTRHRRHVLCRQSCGRRAALSRPRSAPARALVSEWHTRLSRSAWREGFEVVEGDVTDETAVARALEGCEALRGKRACAGTLGDHRDGLAVPVHGEGRVSLAFPRLYSRMTQQFPCWRVRPRGCYPCGIQRRCSNSGRDPTDLDRPGTTSSPTGWHPGASSSAVRVTPVRSALCSRRRAAGGPQPGRPTPASGLLA